MGKKLKLTTVEYGNGITSANAAVKGMFYFSGTGPANTTCNQCAFATDATSRDSDGKAKTPPRAQCQKTTDYLNRSGTAFPPMAASYKYFKRRPAPLFSSAYDQFKGAK